MISRLLIVFTAFLATFAWGQSAQQGVPAHTSSASASGQRHALAIGINDYRGVAPLEKAVSDARAVGRALEQAGFRVTVLTNANRAEMNREINRFVLSLSGGGQGVFFFAGHGVQINNQNFLLPVDMQSPQVEADVADQAISLQGIQDKLADARAKFTLLVVDACRDNPLPRKAGRTLGATRGLAQPSSAEGQMVVFSAGANQQALDKLSNQDAHPNGVFTREFLPWIGKPGVGVRDVVLQVRSAVRALARTVNHEQFPAVYDQVDGHFYLVPASVAATVTAPATISAAAPVAMPAAPGAAVAAVAQMQRERVGRDCDQCPEMVAVPAGSFLMGSPASEAGRSPDEGPQRRVTVAGYAMSKTEITRAQFGRFVAANNYVTDAERNAGGWQGCVGWLDGQWDWRAGRNWRDTGFQQGDDHPVVCLSWNDAQAYVRWLSQQTGQRYGLPTEAQWEYAARAGSTGSRPWGEDAQQACRHANLADQTPNPTGVVWSNRHECADGRHFTGPVGRYLPNGFGLHDMIGNVWEWVEDCYVDSHDGVPADGAARSVGACERRVQRGGGWEDGPADARSASRNPNPVAGRFDTVGLRVVRAVGTP